ncbi:MAG TPA: DUF6600 domain-containing protein [Candidatus Aquilonibacter sp.]|jgi:hypothetical protein|nr:DUF6600 domain-containing protein [Candidatus Aquilonibacter sp.]
MRTTLQKFGWCGLLLGLALIANVLAKPAFAQDDDPPGRVARLGFMEGSVSFQPAGEDDWVGAVPNRPMTTGDKLWTDENSRAEVQLGSAVIRLAPFTGFSFLNLDDNTIQIQLTSGAISVTVRWLNDNDDFEIDTPNLAFTAFQPGHYRIQASEDGYTTGIIVREGDGEATGNGQSYGLHGGQSATFSGADTLYADVEPIGEPDDFDVWSQGRDHRYDFSRSRQYLSRDVVGFDDLDENGDWRDDPQYGHVWFPNRVEVGWAPYHTGHWAWVSPWGWTWVDDAPWGYAPFHYGRWVNAGGRWGWIAGPVAVQAVYAPALVVFVGGGPGGFGGNVGWFPLGPREVFVPSYHVSEGYMTRVNVSSTTVNVTQVTNVYNTTIVHNTTTITNVTYVNRTVQGGVTVVPQQAFVSAQPVAKAAVVVNVREIAAAPVSGRMAVAPTSASVLGSHAATAGHVAAPPAAVANRQVVAKKTPPPPPVPFAKQQQALAAHPGQPLARNEVQTLRPAAAVHPMVKQAPPAKPVALTSGHPVKMAPPSRPSNQPTPHPAPQPAAAPNRPAPAQPNNHPAPAAEPANRPAPTAPASRPAPAAPVNHPEATPSRSAPVQPNNRPANPAPANHPAPAAPANRPPAAQPKPEENHPAPAPQSNRNEPAARPQTPPAEHPQQHAAPPPAAAKPVPQKPKPQTPEEKKRQEEQQKPPGE